MFRKVMFWISVVMAVLVTIYVSGIAGLSIGLVSVLAGITVYTKKNLRMWVMVLSALFLFVNVFAVFSLPDIILWGLMLLAFARR
jgi:predicted membrane protein